MRVKKFTLILSVLLVLFAQRLYSQQNSSSNSVRDTLLKVYNKLKSPEITFEKFYEINRHIFDKGSNSDRSFNNSNLTSAAQQDPYCSKVRLYCTNATFETGLDQNQYVGAYGYWYSGLYPNPFSLTYGFNSGDLYDASAHQTIVDTSMGRDPFTDSSLVPPNGQRQSLRIGNAVNGYGTELIAKTVTVDPNENILSFYYSVVFQDPGHAYQDQPAFSVRAYDCSTGLEIPNVCNLGNGSNVIVSDAQNPFFKSLYNYNYGLIAYRDWSSAQIDLSNYVGKTVIIVFTNKDCNLGGHFGYTYLDNLFSTRCPAPPIPGTSPTPTQGDIIKDTVHTDTCGTGTICGKYKLPYVVSASGDTTFGTITVSLDIYQNSTLIKTLASPAISTYSSDSSYCFSIDPSTLGLDNNGGGFDYTLTGRFSLSGFTPSPIIVGNPGTGIKSGTNNDYLINCLPKNTYYSKSSGNLNEEATWGINPDGSGASPVDFGFAKTFVLANRGTNYTLNDDWSVGGIINIPSGSQLQLNGYTLSEAGLTGTGTLTGSSTSSLIITGSSGGSAGIHTFTSGGGILNNLTLLRSGAFASTTIASALSIIGVLTVNSGTLNTGDFITLKSSATNTARVAPIPSTATISGMVTVERYIPARKAWRLVCAPISGLQTINSAWQEGVTSGNPNPGFGVQITGGTLADGFDQAATSSIKKYTSATDVFDPLDNTNATAVNSNAFMLFVAGDRTLNPSNTTNPATVTTLREKGSLNIGDQTFTVAANGYVAIPNPYASPINFATITLNNVQNSFYLWDPKMGGTNGVGAYVNISYNGTGYDVTPASVSPESQYIQSGQGFLVHSTGTAGSIVIKETDKSGSPTANVFRAAKSDDKGLRINLQTAEKDNTSVLDEVYEEFNHKFSNKIDNFDVLKLANMHENLSIVRNNQNLMVERRDVISENDILNLSLSNTSEKSYFFEFTPVDLASSGLSATLEDKYLHTSVPLDLSTISKHYFKVTSDPASKITDRFKVVILSKNTEPQITSGKVGIKASPNPANSRGSINLQFIDQIKGVYNIELVNGAGSIIMKNTFIHQGGSIVKTIQLGGKLSKGIYEIVVTNGETKNIIKVLIN